MADRPTDSTVPRRQLGRHLRDLRNRARLTVRAAATELEWSETKIWRIETGQTSLRSPDVEAMCRLYGAPDDLAAGLMGLARETKARGWWLSYGEAVPDDFNLYVGLEEAASELSWYSSELVPGLLQTTDYARTVIRTHDPARDDIERRVQVRVGRRALFNRGAAIPTVKMALNEAVIRRPVGGRAVMATQLEYLVEATNHPKVSIRIVPFEMGLQYGTLSGPFIVMRFPTTGDGRETEPPTVYVDGFTGSLYLDKPHEIDRFDAAFNAIWTSALDDAQSRDLLQQAAREFKQ